MKPATSFIRYNSPLGTLLIEAKESAVVSIKFGDDNPSHQTDGNFEILKTIKDELDRYFSGTLICFTVEVAPEGSDFQRSVWAELCKIPYGKTISYSELSHRIGDIKAIRAVGTANGKNPLPIIIPCHRVIGADGSLTGYSGGLDKKEWLLKHEGVLSQLTMSF